jgi:hypothetical protein
LYSDFDHSEFASRKSSPTPAIYLKWPQRPRKQVSFPRLFVEVSLDHAVWIHWCYSRSFIVLMRDGWIDEHERHHFRQIFIFR